MINVFIGCYKILYFTTKNNSNKKLKTLSLAYVIHKYAFLPKGTSNEEIWGVRMVKLFLFYLYFVLFRGFVWGGGGGALCQDSVCML